MTERKRIEDSKLDEISGGIDDARSLQDVTQESGLADASPGSGTTYDFGDDMIVQRPGVAGAGER